MTNASRPRLERFSESCPSRLLFDQVSDKWSMMILVVLDGGPLRFNEIRRRLEGVTQKALTQCLRKLERNGMLERRIIATSPIGVQYGVTSLGRSLQEPLEALHAWTVDHLPEVEGARAIYDVEAA